MDTLDEPARPLGPWYVNTQIPPFPDQSCSSLGSGGRCVVGADTGNSEIYSSSRHALGFYKCVANTCRYSVPLARLRGQAVRDVLETAVANVVLDTPSLSVGIVGQDTSAPRFVQRRSVNLEDHFEYLERANADSDIQDTALIDILEAQHDRSWPGIENRPPWKLTAIVRGGASEDGLLVLDAVFAVHHAIADGRSTALFHTKLLEELNHAPDPPARPSGHILNIPGARELVSPQEELVRFTTTCSFLVQTLWRELGPAWLQGQRPAAPWTGKSIAREPCRTKLKLFTVPADAVMGVLAACRANQTTLTPLLHALALASFAGRLPPEEAHAFQSSTPIDLRPVIDGSSQPGGNRRLFGVFVTGQAHAFDSSVVAALREGLSEDGIWRVAADLGRSMKQRVASLPKDDIISMLGYVTDWQKFWLSKLGKPREHTWEVSNIGSMPGGHGESQESAGATGGWKIQRSTMSQGATVSGAAVSISVAGVTGAEVGIALGWQEGIIETEIVDGVAADLEAWLGRLGRGQSGTGLTGARPTKQSLE